MTNTEVLASDRTLVEQAIAFGHPDQRAGVRPTTRHVRLLLAETVAYEDEDFLFLHGGLSAQEVLVAVVAGARRLGERLRVLELEAARQARTRGVPVRRLADAVGMSERSAADRYRKPRIRLDREPMGDRTTGVGLYGATNDLNTVAGLLAEAGIAFEEMETDGHGMTDDQLYCLDIDPADEVDAVRILTANSYDVEDLNEDL